MSDKLFLLVLILVLNLHSCVDDEDCRSCPQIKYLSPLQGSPTDQVCIAVTNLRGNDLQRIEVKFGDEQAGNIEIIPANFDNGLVIDSIPDTLKVDVPRGGDGPEEVEVIVNGLSSKIRADNNPWFFTYLAPSEITFEPIIAKKGDRITIRGNNFHSGLQVDFGDVRVEEYQLLPNNIISVEVPDLSANPCTKISLFDNKRNTSFDAEGIFNYAYVGLQSLFAGNGNKTDITDLILLDEAVLFNPIDITTRNSKVFFVEKDSHIVRSISYNLTNPEDSFIRLEHGDPARASGFNCPNCASSLSGLYFKNPVSIVADENFIYVADQCYWSQISDVDVCFEFHTTQLTDPGGILDRQCRIDRSFPTGIPEIQLGLVNNTIYYTSNTSIGRLIPDPNDCDNRTGSISKINTSNLSGPKGMANQNDTAILFVEGLNIRRLTLFSDELRDESGKSLVGGELIDAEWNFPKDIVYDKEKKCFFVSDRSNLKVLTETGIVYTVKNFASLASQLMMTRTPELSGVALFKPDENENSVVLVTDIANDVIWRLALE